MACNIALARPHGTHSHYRRAKHIGITREEIMELIIQVGQYAGWPDIAHPVIQYDEVLREERTGLRRNDASKPKFSRR